MPQETDPAGPEPAHTTQATTPVLDLASCPGCGYAPIVEAEDEYAYVRCICGWRGPNAYWDGADPIQRAIDSWNHRARPLELREVQPASAPHPLRDALRELFYRADGWVPFDHARWYHGQRNAIMRSLGEAALPDDRAELVEALKTTIKGYAGEECLPWEMVEAAIDALAPVQPNE